MTSDEFMTVNSSMTQDYWFNSPAVSIVTTVHCYLPIKRKHSNFILIFNALVDGIKNYSVTNEQFIFEK